MTPLIGCTVLKINPIKNYYMKFNFMIPVYEAEYMLFVLRLFFPLRSQLLPTTRSHVLTETCWSVPGSQQLKPVEREIPS